MKKYLFPGLLFILFYEQLTAQLIASETFNYPAGSIVGQNGGTGWGTAWQTTTFNSANATVVIPGLTSLQVAGTGNTNHQVGNDFRNFRMLDTSNAALFPYMDYAGDPGAGSSTNYLFGRAFGKDNTTIWFGMLMRKTSSASSKGYGGMHLMYGYDLSFDQYGNKMAHQRLQFGTDNNVNNKYIISRTINGNPNLAGCANTQYSSTVASATADFLLYRIDFKPGPETVYMWVNPPAGCIAPDISTAAVTTSVCDFRFNAVNIGAGSSSGTVQYDYDEFRIGLTYADAVACGPLPLHFISVNALEKNYGCLVSWKIANDDEVIKYEVEKSTDGINFHLAGFVKRNGSYSYQFIDSTSDATMYYRVKAWLPGNSFFLSQIVRSIKTAQSNFLIYPNPADDHITIINTTSVTQLKVWNLDNCQLLVKKFAAAHQSIELNTSQFATGVYTIELFDGRQYFYKKFVKL